MQKDKHNIYSKEELLKLIKEGKNVSADMDEFEREALEGLKLLDKPDVLLNDLDAEIDSIVVKDKRKKTIYYFSAAASLVLIIGSVLFFKNKVAPDITKNEKPIASAENLKKPEESTLSNTTPITQSETQTTYEAKEPEALDKKKPSDKKDVAILNFQTGPPPGSIENTLLESNGKEQAAKQMAKDAYNEADTKLVVAEKANHYEESKAAASPVSQEQQQGVATTETTSNNNSVLSDREKDNDKSKEKSIVATGNTAPAQQSAQATFSSTQGAKATENSSYQSKNDERVAVQKNKTAGLYQANSPDKKSTAKSYGSPLS